MLWERWEVFLECAQTLENINLDIVRWVEYSAIDHIEDVHEYESMEADCIQLFSFILFVVCHTDRRFYQLERLLEEDELSCEHQNHHNEDLEHRLD